MTDVLVDCAKQPGNPVMMLCDAMDWDISFSSLELRELEKYLTIVKPMWSLFSSLNSDSCSTLQKVIPSIQVL